jgi:NAD(P)-dependent dehydrogenase (short-subunit alcohol dehydrogenase family)
LSQYRRQRSRWSLSLCIPGSSPYRRVGVGPVRNRRSPLRGWGRIINVASVHGLVASRNKAAYVTAKHGLLGLTKTAALEAAARCPDVTVTAVCPWFVRTPLVEKQIGDQAKLSGLRPEQVVDDLLLERTAVKRLIEPDDVAAIVEFLCVPAAWTMTGIGGHHGRGLARSLTSISLTHPRRLHSSLLPTVSWRRAGTRPLCG